MREKPAERAAEPAVMAAAGAVWRARLRVIALALGGVLLLSLLLILGRELIAARVPEHRAALEQLIRDQTGLEITFTRLSVRWGWYGPEAVFHGVALGEPGAAPLLRATQLSAALDAWRTMRSGHLEAGRITLIAPDIDLTAWSAAPANAGRAGVLGAGPGLLSRWRGGRIDVEAASVRLPAPSTAAAMTVLIPHADLRRLGADWSVQAQLQLPESLGERAQLALRLTGDPARPETIAGTVTFSAERLAFGGWHALDLVPDLEPYLPSAGRGGISLTATLAGGAARRIAGSVTAHALEWSARADRGHPLTLPQLRANWQLTRSGSGWRVALGALDVGAGAANATALLELAADGTRGTLHQVPLPALASVARWYLPQLPLEALAPSGVAQVLSFDWNGARPPGARLQARADVTGLTLASAAQGLRLAGLKAVISASDSTLTAQLDADAAKLVVARATPLTLTGLELHGHLSAAYDGPRWQLRSEDLEVRHAGAHLAASVALNAPVADDPPRLAARVHIDNADAFELATLLGADTLSTLGPAATRLRAGHIASADFELQGVLAAAGAAASPLTSHGTLELSDAALSGDAQWPPLEELATRIDWQGTRVRASISGARSGALNLSDAHAGWDTRAAQALRLTARLQGSAREALQWLRARPQFAASAPGVAYLDVEGDTLLDVDLVVPGNAAHQPPARTRITALLDAVRLRPLAGLPPIEALQGTLAFSGGHLLRSSLTGHWLGGPVTLAVGERRADAALLISAHGLLDVRQALQASGIDRPDAALSGGSEWSAQLTALVQPDAQQRWQVRADSNLLGVGSGLPEPLAKGVNAIVPLHLEAQGEGMAAQLHASLGERLRGTFALERSGDRWRIVRGALRLGTDSPVLPDAPVLTLEGRLGALDLPACLSVWRLLGRSPILPALEARLSAAQLEAGPRSFAEALLSAHADAQGGSLEVRSDELGATFSWPAVPDAAHPGLVHLTRFELGRSPDVALAAALPAILGGPVQLTVDDLFWQGRSLGHLAATVSSPAEGLLVSDLRLGAPHQELRGSGQCVAAASCSAHLTLESTDFAATLAAYGLRPDLAARRAVLSAELEWPQDSAAPLASLSGHLHMQLEEGTTDSTAPPNAAPPLSILLVPALMSGMSPDAAAGREPRAELRFARLTADYELHDAVASTANLHFDGDAEILMRARVGLLAQDYDGEAFILRGEERLPSAVRRLGPTPKVAALWLSLREWFTGASPDNARSVLRLRGGWNDPIVGPVE